MIIKGSWAFILLCVISCGLSRPEAKKKAVEQQKKVNRRLASEREQRAMDFRLLFQNKKPPEVTQVIWDIWQPKPGRPFDRENISDQKMTFRLSSKASPINLRSSQVLDFIDVLVQTGGRDQLLSADQGRLPLLVGPDVIKNHTHFQPWQTNLYRASFFCEVEAQPVQKGALQCDLDKEVQGAVQGSYSILEPGKSKDLPLFPSLGPRGIESLKKSQKQWVIRFLRLPGRAYLDAEWNTQTVLKALSFPLNVTPCSLLSEWKAKLLIHYHKQIGATSLSDFVKLGFSDPQEFPFAVAEEVQRLSSERHSLSRAWVAEGYRRLYQDEALQLFGESEQKEFWNLFHTGLLHTLTSVSLPLLSFPSSSCDRLQEAEKGLNAVFQQALSFQKMEDWKSFSQWVTPAFLGKVGLAGGQSFWPQRMKEGLKKRFGPSDLTDWQPSSGPSLLSNWVGQLAGRYPLFLKQLPAHIYYAVELEIYLKQQNSNPMLSFFPLLFDQKKPEGLMAFGFSGEGLPLGYRLLGVPQESALSWIQVHFPTSGQLTMKEQEADLVIVSSKKKSDTVFDAKSEPELRRAHIFFEGEYLAP